MDILISELQFLVGQKTIKDRNKTKNIKPFKSRLMYNTIKSIEINPNTGNIAFSFYEDESIVDIKTFLLTITQPADVLTDTTGGMIRETIEDTRWADIIDIDKRLTSEVGKFVKKWGIKVEKVTLTDLQIANSIRIIQDSTHQSKVVPINENI
jgi:hypothetical protein